MGVGPKSFLVTDPTFSKETPNDIEAKVKNFTTCRYQNSSVLGQVTAAASRSDSNYSSSISESLSELLISTAPQLGRRLFGLFHLQTLLKSAVWIVFEPDPMNARFRYPKMWAQNIQVRAKRATDACTEHQKNG